MYDELEFEGILVEIKKKNLGGHFSGKKSRWTFSM
jgi:hypothetical protein